jgi:hypothetical protein
MTSIDRVVTIGQVNRIIYGKALAWENCEDFLWLIGRDGQKTAGNRQRH